MHGLLGTFHFIMISKKWILNFQKKRNGRKSWRKSIMFEWNNMVILKNCLIMLYNLAKYKTHIILINNLNGKILSTGYLINFSKNKDRQILKLENVLKVNTRLINLKIKDLKKGTCKLKLNWRIHFSRYHQEEIQCWITSFSMIQS